MTEREKCAQGMLYDANYDLEMCTLRQKCKDLCHTLNALLPSEVDKQQKLLTKILKSLGKTCVITTPFWCDYGSHIIIGDNFYANHNLVILDGAMVHVGNHVFIGPHCCISTAGHPIDHEQRNAGLEFAYPIYIEDNVWIGAHVSILPGVRIGKNTVIGAGSVVTKDIPENCIAAGVPCRVLRTISEQDKTKYHAVPPLSQHTPNKT